MSIISTLSLFILYLYFKFLYHKKTDVITEEINETLELSDEDSEYEESNSEDEESEDEEFEDETTKNNFNYNQLLKEFSI